MSQAPHDQNWVSAKIGVLCTDGITLVPLAINPATGGISVDLISSIGFTPGSIDFNAAHYENVWRGVSSVDGTSIPLFVNASGALLISSS